MRSLHDVVTRWWRNELGTAGDALDVVTMPAQLLYNATTSVRNTLYDNGLFATTKLDVPVVSVGNLSVGGTGKTPVTAWIARALRDGGARPAILHGGYALDEPALHKELNPDIPVFTGRDRIAEGQSAIRNGANILVLDDAFQHRRIARDIDIVLVAAESWKGRHATLPRGPWREHVSALGRADWLVVTRRTASAGEAEMVGSEMPAKNTAIMALDASRWTHNNVASDKPDGPAHLVTAIANPEAFMQNAQDAGADIVSHAFFPDHHEFTEDDAKDIEKQANGNAIVTTAKDWVKLRHHVSPTRAWILTQRVIPEQNAHQLLHAITALV